MSDEQTESTQAPDEGPPRSRSIDWFAPGEAKTVAVGGVEVTIGFVARNGRRAPIAITAPPGAEFRGDTG